MVHTSLDKIIWILVLVIIIRIFLIQLPSYRIDMNTWQAWSARLVEVTPIHFYAPDYFADYFPGYLYILWFLGTTFNFLFPYLSIFSVGFEIYLKFFTNIFDVATAYYIYKIVSRYRQNLGLLSAMFYLANPALAFNSVVMGQVDGILTFFLIYSAYNLLELKKVYRFSIASSLSLLIKPQGLTIFPITITYFITNFKKIKYISLILIPVVLVLLSLPFFIKDPLLGIFHLFQRSASVYPYTSIFSYNFWSFIGWWIPDSNKFLTLTYQAWGVIIYLITLVLILNPLISKKGYKNNSLVYFALSLVSFSFFMFLTRMHERYLFPFFAFLLVVAFVYNSLKLKVIYMILSLIHFINLGHVYYYYNYVYANSTFSSFLIYKLVSENYNLFTLLNLLGFGILMFIYYNLSNNSKSHV